MKLKKYLQDAAIVVLALIAFKNLLAALPWRFIQKFEHFYNTVIDPGQAAIQHALSFLLGAVMLLLVIRLYRRVRLAWVVEVTALLLTVVLQVIHYHRFTVPIVLLEVFVLLVLCITYRDFGRKADRITVKEALLFIGASLFLLLLNATIGLFWSAGHIGTIGDFAQAFVNSVKLLVLLDTGGLDLTSVFTRVYVFSLSALNWLCILAALFLLLKPMVFTPIITKRDREKVRRLVLQYGQNPMAYLALEHDKKYFFSAKCAGVCSYTVVSDVFVACGDMVCDAQDGALFLREIMDFCDKNAYHILFTNVTDCFYQVYQAAGFGLVKLGEECCFKLAEYNLAGGKVAKVRAAINHATKAGIVVKEYKPLEGKDERIEQQISDISAEWLSAKGGYELGFTVGGTALAEPLDRRYFYASAPDGRMLGFVVFLPYIDGYLADVTRRRKDAPQGVLEKTIYEAFMLFRDEGVTWGNMGLSTLYNVAEHDKLTMTEKLFTFIYEHMNAGFSFQQLHHAKEKYAPTHWIPRHLAFYPKPFTPKLAYALVRCQFKTGFSKLVLTEVLKRDE